MSTHDAHGIVMGWREHAFADHQSASTEVSSVLQAWRTVVPPRRVPAISRTPRELDLRWPEDDMASRRADTFLMSLGVDVPWHYGSPIATDMWVVGLRAGGAGVVLAARSTRRGMTQLCAAKTLQQFLTDDFFESPAWARGRLAHEFLAEALPWLEMGRHEHIVEASMLLRIEHPRMGRTIPFVVSEWVPGGDLRAHLRSRGRLPVQDSLRAIIDVNHALTHANLCGVGVHKDLKPENILRSESGTLKVTDFGAGMICTPGYAAPEQVRRAWDQSAQVDHRADQFALGTMFLEMVNGTHPFPELRGTMQGPRARSFGKAGVGAIPWGETPASLRDVLARCLAFGPEDRFPDSVMLETTLLKAYREHFGRIHGFALEARERSPGSWFDLANSLVEIGRSASAETPYRRALGQLPATRENEMMRADCLMGLGGVCFETRRFPEARAIFEEAETLLSLNTRTEARRIECLRCLADIACEEGAGELAGKVYQRAFALLDAHSVLEHQRARCLEGLAKVQSKAGLFGLAEMNYFQSLALLACSAEPEVDQARCHMGLGELYAAQGDWPKADAEYKEALGFSVPLLGMELMQGTCYLGLAKVHTAVNDLATAEFLCEGAFRIFTEIPGTECQRGHCFAAMGDIYLCSDRIPEAENAYVNALGFLREFPGTLREQAACEAALASVGARRFDMVAEKNPIEVRGVVPHVR
jgi:tetratricopeptide (TPR) repeat protein